MIEIIPMIVMVALFILIILGVVIKRLNKTIISVIAGIITIIFLIGWYAYSFTDSLFLMVGGAELSYLKLFMLIIGMNIITIVLYESGVFQFITLKTIKFTKGKVWRMLLIFALVTVLISSIISNLLTIFVIVPITVMFCSIFKIDAEPYIILEAIVVNIGGLITLISSNLNILVCNIFSITFGQFFVYFAPLGFILIFITILLAYFLLHKKLQKPSEKYVRYLEEFDPWSIVKDKKQFYKAIIIFIATIIGFILFSDYLGLISIISAMLMLLFVVKDKKKGFESIKMSTILYFAGIFLTLEGLKISGLFTLLGTSLSIILPENILIISLIILWISAFASAPVANIPIALALSPIIQKLVSLPFVGEKYKTTLVTSLILGANLGDNLFPAGDNIIFIDISEQNGQKLSFKKFFIVGFLISIVHLVIASFYLLLLINIIR